MWIPSGKRLHSYGKSPSLLGKSAINGPLSLAMLNYQRVWYDMIYHLSCVNYNNSLTWKKNGLRVSLIIPVKSHRWALISEAWWSLESVPLPTVVEKVAPPCEVQATCSGSVWRNSMMIPKLEMKIHLIKWWFPNWKWMLCTEKKINDDSQVTWNKSWFLSINVQLCLEKKLEMAY